MLPRESMLIPEGLDVDEANRIEVAFGPLFEAATIFPLHGIRQDGSCACGLDPCASGPGKHPAVRWSPEHYPNGSKTFAREDGVGVGIGLATGSRSGGIVVLDLDQKGDLDGVAALEELERVWGKLPPTFTVEGPAGGQHLYFRTSARIKSCASEIADGIDLRGEGGYVVLPGSPHRKGGCYRIAKARAVAHLPPMWVDRLPKAGERGSAGRIVPDQIVGLDAATLRQRLADHVRGKRKNDAATLRRVALGERMFRLEGGPGDPEIPVVVGVDEHLTKRVIWPLVMSEGDWHAVPGSDMGQVFAASLAILREDAEACGTPSKWTPDHFAQKWDTAAGKAAAEKAAGDAFVARLEEAAARAEVSKAAGLPLILQWDDRFFVLDERADPPWYEGPLKSVSLVPMARQLWVGTGRPLEIEGKTGQRAMLPAEAVQAYGAQISTVVRDYAATRPEVEDLTLRIGPPRLKIPEPRHDPDVAAWLALLARDDLGAVLDWIVWAAPEYCDRTVPALALVGGPWVGKSLLADGLAAAAGLLKAATLSRALGQFGSILGNSPILFSDEGMPRDRRTGQPLTEEFRALVTSTAHVAERKGSDVSLLVRGGVRVILAANNVTRLFVNKGTMNADDVGALVRRLVVVNTPAIDTPEHAACVAAAVALGTAEGDPVRLARVAGHLRYVQITHRAAQPTPRAGTVQAELRRGGDLTAEILHGIEDRIGTADYLLRGGGLLWYRPDLLARALEWKGGPSALARALVQYTRHPSRKCRTHPVTGAPTPNRERWAALDLEKLLADGWDLG